MSDYDELFCASAVYDCYEDGVFGEQGTELYVRLRDAWVSDMSQDRPDFADDDE